ncbi:MAG: hypothetical protein WAV07_00020 [Candidatus Contendobacter sp.]
MSTHMTALCGLVFSIAASVSVADSYRLNRGDAGSGREFNSAYDVTGIALHPTGKFANSLTGNDGITPQAVTNPVPGTLLVESTLSRQFYHANSTPTRVCNTFTTYKWPNYRVVFEDTITPQNLSSGKNVIEINFSTQATILPTSSTEDGIALACLVYQPANSLDSVPCSGTANGPILLRNRQNLSEKGNQAFVFYQGYAEIDNTESVKVVIGVANTTGTTGGNVCFSTLVLRTR